MADYDAYNYGVTADYGDYSYEGPQGFMYVKFTLDVWFGYPLAIILNLMLFIKFVRTPKIKGEPWRWLIVNTSFVASLQAFLLLDGYIAYNYQIPTLTSTALCPGILLLGIILSCMYYIFNFLVIIERFHALRLGKEEGGFGKKAVILCLVLFWIFITIGSTLAVVAKPMFYGRRFYVWYEYSCYLTYSTGQEFIPLAIWPFLFPAFITVFIGSFVLRKRKTTNPEMIRSNVKPTLAASALGFILLVGNLTLDVLPLFVPFVPVNQPWYFLRTTFSILHMIAFPLIWIVTWSKNGDISLPCCKVDQDEERQLLKPK